MNIKTRYKYMNLGMLSLPLIGGYALASNVVPQEDTQSAQSDAATSDTEYDSHSHGPDHDCGYQDPIVAKIVPSSVQQDEGSAARLRFDVEFTSHLNGQRDLLYSVATYDPQGNSVAPATYAAALLRLPSHANAHAGQLKTPKELPDGYYRTIVEYAASDGSRADTGFQNLSYEIANGDLHIMDPSEWEQKSGHNQGQQG